MGTVIGVQTLLGDAESAGAAGTAFEADDRARLVAAPDDRIGEASLTLQLHHQALASPTESPTDRQPCGDCVCLFVDPDLTGGNRRPSYSTA